MAWSRDKTKFYFSDSKNGVFVYDYDNGTGEIKNRKLLFKADGGSDGQAVSDGMCIDSDDNLGVAVWGGRRVEKHSGKTGEKLAEISVDTDHVTSCCFCGPDLDTLLITSSADGLKGQFDGCLFKCRVNAKGLPPAYLNIFSGLQD